MAHKEKYVRMNISVISDAHRAIKIASAAEGISATEFILDAIGQKLIDYKVRYPDIFKESKKK